MSSLPPPARKVRVRFRIPLVIGFGFVSGWADAICMRRYRAFATMMTGNFFQLGFCTIYPVYQWTGHGHHATQVHVDVLFFSAVICMYLLGTVLYRMGEIMFPHRTGSVFGPLMAAFLITFEVFEIFHERRWIVCLLAPIFAVQNGLTMRGGLNVPTAFLTGHLTNVGYGIVDAVVGAEGRAECKTHGLHCMILASVAAGACGGALWEYSFGSHFALVPVAPVMAVLFVIQDSVFHPGSAVIRRSRPSRAWLTTELSDVSPAPSPV